MVQNWANSQLTDSPDWLVVVPASIGHPLLQCTYFTFLLDGRTFWNGAIYGKKWVSEWVAEYVPLICSECAWAITVMVFLFTTTTNNCITSSSRRRSSKLQDKTRRFGCCYYRCFCTPVYRRKKERRCNQKKKEEKEANLTLSVQDTKVADKKLW